MERLATRIVLLIASAIATVALVAVAPITLHDRIAYGSFAMTGTPPRVDYCGRRYYPGNQAQNLAQINAFMTTDGWQGVGQIDTAPSGMPILAGVMSPAMRARYQTNVCAMSLWVQTGPDSYIEYVLSGGP
ncbi:MAG: hypothetical protein ACHQ0J_12470 [Candidatus Dormibacterales bacterium]